MSDTGHRFAHDDECACTGCTSVLELNRIASAFRRIRHHLESER